MFTEDQRTLILGCLRRERQHAQDEMQRLCMEITRPFYYTNHHKRKAAEACLKEWTDRAEICRKAIQVISELQVRSSS